MTLNIIVTGVVAIPPGGTSITKIFPWKEKKVEQQKYAPCSSFRSLSGPSGSIKYDQGHNLIILVAIVLMTLSCIFEALGKKPKKSE